MKNIKNIMIFGLLISSQTMYGSTHQEIIENFKFTAKQIDDRLNSLEYQMDILNPKKIITICAGTIITSLLICIAIESYKYYTQLDNNELMIALHNNNLQKASELIAAGANVNVQDKEGATALIWAALLGYESIVTQLIAAGADANLPDIYGQTPLMWAASYGHKSITTQLLAAGADINLQDNQGRTALIACTSNRFDSSVATIIIPQLLAAGADVNIQDKNGNTALMNAYIHTVYLLRPLTDDEILFFMNFAADTVTQLLAAGADTNLQNNKGQTALDIARKQNYQEIANLIKNRQKN